MSCYYPIKGYRSIYVNKDTGKRGIVFSPMKGYSDLPMELPCGKCIGCRLDKAKEWAVRCVKEASLYKENCFVTLTYSPEKIPSNGSLCPRNFTLFMKKLRKRLERDNLRIRFFQCGEYGEGLGRPHHHCIIFGWMPPDMKLWRQKGNTKLFRSKILEDIWGNGFVTIGFVTYESAFYVTRYILKKITGDKAEEHYQGKHPEYITMSKKPGIAHDWFQKYYDDVYGDDSLVYGLGKLTKPPRYFDKMYEKMNPEHFKEIHKDRMEREANSDYNSEYRLKVREKLQNIKVKQLNRELHNTQ